MCLSNVYGYLICAAASSFQSQQGEEREREESMVETLLPKTEREKKSPRADL